MSTFLYEVFNFLMFLAVGMGYGHIGGRHARIVDARMRASADEPLTNFAFLLIAILWPVSVVLWVAACLKTRQVLPGPFTRDVERAREQARLAARKAERDWEGRAAFWHAEGQRAEDEDDQALKWFVAEQLAFLLDTKPDGAQDPGQKAKEEVDREAVKFAKAKFKAKRHLDKVSPSYIKPVTLDASAPAAKPAKLVDWADFRAQLGRDGARKGSDLVGFCNLCHKYRDHQHLAMEGICLECSDEQGLR